VDPPVGHDLYSRSVPCLLQRGSMRAYIVVTVD